MRKVNKHTLLNSLEDFTDVPDSFSIAELKDYLQKEIEEDKQKQVERNKTVINMYKGKYLIDFGDDPLFGKTTKVYHISDIKDYSHDDMYVPVYLISGEKLEFNTRGVYKSLLNDENAKNLFRESTLNQFEVISKDRYQEFKKKYKEIKLALNKTLKHK